MEKTVGEIELVESSLWCIMNCKVCRNRTCNQHHVQIEDEVAEDNITYNKKPKRGKSRNRQNEGEESELRPSHNELPRKKFMS